MARQLRSVSEPNRLFASRVREVRRHRDMTQEDLGGQIGLSRAAMTALENGHREVSIGEAVALCVALSVPLAGMVSAEPLVLLTATEIA